MNSTPVRTQYTPSCVEGWGPSLKDPPVVPGKVLKIHIDSEEDIVQLGVARGDVMVHLGVSQVEPFERNADSRLAPRIPRRLAWTV